MKLTLALLFALALQAQTHVALGDRTGVTSEKVTLAIDPADRTRIQACSVVINASVGGTVYTEVSGAAATSTALTPVPTSPGGSTAKALVYGASNVGAGTATSKPMTIAAGVPFLVSLKGIGISGTGTTKNLTVVIALGSSGNVTTSIYWTEGDVSCGN